MDFYISKDFLHSAKNEIIADSTVYSSKQGTLLHTELAFADDVMKVFALPPANEQASS